VVTFLTLGIFALGIGRRRFRERFASAVCTRQGYPRAWPELSNCVVYHESRHTTQATWFGWFFLFAAWASRRLRAWLGLVPNLLVYAFLPLPVYLAAGRFYLELDADRAAWCRCLAEGSMRPVEVRARAWARAQSLSSGDYVWAWPSCWAHSAYKKTAEKVIEEFEKGA